MSNSASKLPTALSKARLGALTPPRPGDFSPYACRPPLGSTRPLPAELNERFVDRIRRQVEKSGYPPI
jgi:hypothetical protein